MTTRKLRLRNIGISAHIDSGKTTLTERMLFYSGRVRQMREVHDKGATMDSDPIERQRGITINSAATTIGWRDHQINLIDTPGHVDFTIEVERSLRVLDGAILVLCSVAGVQSQSLTVDRQIRRYGVPRIALINKLDRMGANPDNVIREMREKLNTNAVALQIPIGLESEFIGIIDLIEMQAVYFDGEHGEIVRRESVPTDLRGAALQARTEMLEALAMLDDLLFQALTNEQTVSVMDIRRVVRAATLAQQLTPVLMASAYQNRGVQEVLDAVTMYLPSPEERETHANEVTPKAVESTTPVRLYCDEALPMVAMAFKTVVEDFGQLTYLRIYQGKIEKGASYRNSRTGQLTRFGRLVRIHADQREEISLALAGEIVGLVGIDCAFGETFTEPELRLSLTDIWVPEPVVQLSIVPRHRKDSSKLAKALDRFRREDPTFRVMTDSRSGETLIAGMGQLHLEVYLERIEAEFDCPCEIGKPRVAYQERPTRPVEFTHRLKKMNGGQGQFAHLVGRLDLLEDEADENFCFTDEIVGGRIERKFISAARQGFESSLREGPLGRFEVVGVKVTLQDGQQHEKDSNEFAFKNCAADAMQKVILPKAAVALWEPMVSLEVTADSGFHGTIAADLGRKRGSVISSEVLGSDCKLVANVPLAELFDYASEIRSLTRGTASFSMSPTGYQRVPAQIQEMILADLAE